MGGLDPIYHYSMIYLDYFEIQHISYIMLYTHNIML